MNNLIGIHLSDICYMNCTVYNHFESLHINITIEYKSMKQPQVR